METAASKPSENPSATPNPDELTIGPGVPADRLRMREAIKQVGEHEAAERVHEIVHKDGGRKDDERKPATKDTDSH